MALWYGADDTGHLAVFQAEHSVPGAGGELVAYDELRDGALDLTLALSRLLRTDQRPVPGVHVRVRAGLLQMLAAPEIVTRYATAFEPLADGVVVARFPPPQRGRESSFMPGVRTFGAGDSDPVSSLERAHAD